MSKRVLIRLSSWILMKKNSYNCYLCYLRTLQSYFKLHAKTKSQFEPNLKNSCSKDEQIKTLSHDVRNLSLYKTKHFIFTILTIPVQYHYKHLYAQNLSRHVRICYIEKLFIIPYTHLYSQNNSDGVRFPFVRKLSFHDHQNMYVLTVNSHFIRLKTSLHHHVRFVLKVLTPSNTAIEQIRILFPCV